MNMKKKYEIIIIIPIIILLLIAIFTKLDAKQLSSEHYLDLYEQLISDVINNNEEYQKVKYIAIDANSFGIVNDHEKGLLMNYVRKYNPSVAIGTYDMIKGEKDLIDKDGNLTGVLMYCTNLERKGKNVAIDITTLTKESKVTSYRANYLLNKWSYNTNTTLMK